jgi:hypothetical protein
MWDHYGIKDYKGLVGEWVEKERKEGREGSGLGRKGT